MASGRLRIGQAGPGQYSLDAEYGAYELTGHAAELTYDGEPQEFELISLVDGIDGGLSAFDGSVGDFSATWTTDETGSFARLNYPQSGNAGLVWSTTGSPRQMYVKYDIRRHQTECTKQFKFHHENNGTGLAYSNATAGPTGSGYSGGRYFINYGENATGPNDTACHIRMNEARFQSRSPLPTIGYASPSADTGSQDYTSGAWETWEVWIKYNDPEVPNGEFAVWKNGTLLVWAHTLWNCVNIGGEIALIALGDYTSSDAGIIEDYRNLYINYVRPTGRGID